MYFQYSTFHFSFFFKKDLHFYPHLAWSILWTVSIDKTVALQLESALHRQPSQALHNLSSVWKRGSLSFALRRVPPASSRSLRSTSQCRQPQRRRGASQGSWGRREGARAEGLGWADTRRRAEVADAPREANRELADAETGAPESAALSGGAGPPAWTLSARSRRLRPAAQLAPRLSPPSESRWYSPADSESLKRAGAAQASRFGPDLCARRVSYEPGSATPLEDVGGGVSCRLGGGRSFGCGARACVAVQPAAKAPRRRLLGSLSSRTGEPRAPPARRGMEQTEVLKPRTLADLIRILHQLFAGEEVNVEEVQAVMEAYESDPAEWAVYAKFDQYR